MGVSVNNVQSATPIKIWNKVPMMHCIDLHMPNGVSDISHYPCSLFILSDNNHCRPVIPIHYRFAICLTDSTQKCFHMCTDGDLWYNPITVTSNSQLPHSLEKMVPILVLHFENDPLFAAKH